MLRMRHGPALLDSKLADLKISQLLMLTLQIPRICFSAHAFQDDLEGLRKLRAKKSLKLLAEIFREVEDHAPLLRSCHHPSSPMP